MSPRLAPTREGSTELLVPAESLKVKDPATHPAFFNPAARLNRDVSVAMAGVTRPREFLDALAGTGARGVRVAKEASKEVRVTMVEFNETSLGIAKRNAARNRVASRCEFVREESNAFLHSRFGRLERFDAVDVDPFGTPAPYVQGALSAADDGGVVSMTATDTATLCGVFPSVAQRRYGARVVKTEFPHELAVRVLAGYCARVGGALDVGVRPVAAHTTLHYLRVYLRVERGAARSDSCLRELRLVAACPACHEHSVLEPPAAGTCPRCGQKAALVGPLWAGRLLEEPLVSQAASLSAGLGFAGAAAALGALEGIDDLPPHGYSLEAITSRERRSSVRFLDVLGSLEKVGRKAIRQPFGRGGIKTDASYAELLEAVRGAAAGSLPG